MLRTVKGTVGLLMEHQAEKSISKVFWAESDAGFKSEWSKKGNQGSKWLF